MHLWDIRLRHVNAKYRGNHTSCHHTLESADFWLALLTGQSHFPCFYMNAASNCPFLHLMISWAKTWNSPSSVSLLYGPNAAALSVLSLSVNPPWHHSLVCTLVCTVVGIMVFWTIVTIFGREHGSEEYTYCYASWLSLTENTRTHCRSNLSITK